MDIVVYTQTGCSPCRLFKRWLRNNNIVYHEKNIGEYEAYRNEFLDRQGKAVPYIIITQDGVETSYVGASSKLKKLLLQEKHLSS